MKSPSHLGDITNLVSVSLTVFSLFRLLMVLHIKKRKPMRTERVGMMRRVSLTYKLCFFFFFFSLLNLQVQKLMNDTLFGFQQQERQRRRRRKRTVLRKRQTNIPWNVQQKRRWVWVSIHTWSQMFPACLIIAFLLFQEAVETKKQKTEENGGSTEAEVKA